MVEGGDAPTADLEAKAARVAPLQRRSSGKKGKTFATVDYMLKVIEDANRSLETKSSEFFEREGDILRRIAQRDKQRVQKKATRADRLEQIKDRMRDKKSTAISSSRGIHNKEQSSGDKTSKKSSGKPGRKGGAQSSATKKRVSFKD